MDDVSYPKKLLSLSAPPKQIYYVGDIELLNKNIVAVIGKRETTEDLFLLAKEVGKALAEKENVILNGLALGCDTKAIEGALQNNGKIIAVLPGGLDEIYPKQNRLLAEQIVSSGGCLVSEYPSGVKPQKYTFIARDRIQAGLADKIIVIDAEINGGTMHTVNYAIKLKKEIGCIIENTSSGGNKFLCGTKKCDSLKNIQSVINFVNKPGYSQLSLFN